MHCGADDVVRDVVVVVVLADAAGDGDDDDGGDDMARGDRPCGGVSGRRNYV
jgi:hypothetical protein